MTKRHIWTETDYIGIYLFIFSQFHISIPNFNWPLEPKKPNLINYFIYQEQDGIDIFLFLNQSMLINYANWHKNVKSGASNQSTKYGVWLNNVDDTQWAKIFLNKVKKKFLEQDWKALNWSKNS